MQRLISFSILALLLLTPDLAKAEDSPVAILIGPEHIIVGGTVLFDGSFSYHQSSTQSIANYEWFVDGMSKSSGGSEKTFTHPFAATGSFIVKLTVTDDNGLDNSTEITVTVSAAPGRYYYLADHLGSVRATVNENGDVVGYDDYYPFGLQMAKRSGVGDDRTREKFTGHELDQETGLVYAGARYYMPEVGRWMSVDPLADDFVEWSPYNYALNNPSLLTDPTGMAPEAGDCPPNCDLGGVLRETFGGLEPTFNETASNLGIEQVQTQPPKVYKGLAAVRKAGSVVSVGGAVVALAATGCGAGAGCVAALGGTSNTAFLAATAGVVSNLGGLLETGAAVGQAFEGETTVADALVTATLNIGVGGLVQERVFASFARIADDILLPSRLDPIIDSAIAGSRRDATHVAVGLGAVAGVTASNTLRSIIESNQKK